MLRFTVPLPLLGALLLAAVPVSSTYAEDLVVDNADPAVSTTGDWTTTSLTAGFHGANYQFRVAGDGTARVWWPFPGDAPPGTYEVSARWTSGPNRATDAPYTITHATGSSTIRTSQQTDGGTWQPLGTYAFAPDAGHGVTLSDAADGVVIADAIRWVGPLEATTPPADRSEPTASPGPPVEPTWAVTFEAAPIHAGPDAASHQFGVLRRFSYLRVLGYHGAWAYVYDPRADGTAYAPGDLLGPAEPPPAYYTAPPPPAMESFDTPGRVVGETPATDYPVDDEWMTSRRLAHNTPVRLTAMVEGLEGEGWYRTAAGDYLPQQAVRLPRTPPRTFAGRWLDADLQEPALVTAYEGDRVVWTALATKGTRAWETPRGVFTIQRRVANETMDSATLGIPRSAPGGYFLENVLYTQYFLPTGESLHYNYWSANFGYGGSHGCLGLNYADATFVWDWASLGTPIVIRE